MYLFNSPENPREDWEGYHRGGYSLPQTRIYHVGSEVSIGSNLYI